MNLFGVTDALGVVSVAGSLFALHNESAGNFSYICLNPISWVSVEYIAYVLVSLLNWRQRRNNLVLRTWCASLLLQLWIVILGIAIGRNAPIATIVAVCVQVVLLLVQSCLLRQETDDDLKEELESEDAAKKKPKKSEPQKGLSFKGCFGASFLAATTYFIAVYTLKLANVIEAPANVFVSKFITEGMAWFGFYCRVLLDMAIGTLLVCRFSGKASKNRAELRYQEVVSKIHAQREKRRRGGMHRDDQPSKGDEGSSDKKKK